LKQLSINALDTEKIEQKPLSVEI